MGTSKETRSQRASRLADVERGLAAAESQLAIEADEAATAGDERHHDALAHAAGVHRTAAALHADAAELHERHAAHTRDTGDPSGYE